MNPHDLSRELRAARPTASPALRETVRAIATRQAPQPVSLLTRLRSRRRPLLVALPAAAALAAVGAGIAGLAGSPGRDTVALEATANDRRADSPTLAQPALPTTPAATEAYGQLESSVGEAAKQAAPPAGAGSPPTPDAARAQRFFATIALEVEGTDALSDATQKAIQATKALGGYIVTASYGAAETGTSSLTLRVPTGRVQDAIARLTGLGKIVSQHVQIDDLQASLDETGRRARVLRARIATIATLLERPDLDARRRAQLEKTRQDLRAELDALRRQETAVRGEASYATIQLQLQTAVDESAVPATPSRFDRGVDDAVAILAIEGLVALYALVVMVPLGLAGLALWLVARAFGRRGRERLLASS